MHWQAVGMQELSDFPYLPSAISSTSASTPYEPPGETFTT